MVIIRIYVYNTYNRYKFRSIPVCKVWLIHAPEQMVAVMNKDVCQPPLKKKNEANRKHYTRRCVRKSMVMIYTPTSWRRTQFQTFGPNSRLFISFSALVCVHIWSSFYSVFTCW